MSMASPGSRRRIDANPPPGKLWIQEKGAPWRSAWEFRQVAEDSKARAEIFDKRILQMARQVAAGVKTMYGRDYDFAVLQHTLREAMTLAREDLPSSLKPQVTKERAVWLKQVLTACSGFNIPKVKQLMKINVKPVYNTSMSSTAYHLSAVQAKGGNSAPMTSAAVDAMRAEALQRRFRPPPEFGQRERLREEALGHLFRAIKFQKGVYGRTMGHIRDFFWQNDKCKQNVVTRGVFRDTMKQLGLGMTEDEMDSVIEALDVDASGLINYDVVLQVLSMDKLEFRENKVPGRVHPDVMYQYNRALSKITAKETLAAQLSESRKDDKK